MGVNSFTNVIQRVKEVQQFLGQTIPSPVQWTGYPMGWQNANPQGMQYPYGGVMYPQAYPGQTPGTQGGGTPFPPQSQAQIAGQKPKMNFMAAKNVSFSPQLETVIGVKDALTDVAGEINALKSQFSNNFDTKLRQIKEELKDSSSLRMKDDLQDFLHNQPKAMDRSIEKLVHVMDKQSNRRDREKDWDKNRSRDRDRNAGYRSSYRDSYRDQSRSPSRDRYSRPPSRSPGYIGIIGRIEIETEIGTEIEIIEGIEVHQVMVMTTQDLEVVQELDTVLILYADIARKKGIYRKNVLNWKRT